MRCRLGWPLFSLVLLLRISIFVLFFVPVQDFAQLMKLWEISLRRSPFYVDDATPAMAADGTIYQPSFTGSLFAIAPNGTTKWEFQAGLEIESSPAIGNDGTIYFGSRDRKFYAVSSEGKLKWAFETGAWNDSSPAISDDGTIYFGSWDGNFYALRPDGTLKWKFPAGGIVDSSPAVGADGTIYFGSHDKKFYAVTPNGALKWSFATSGQIYSSPAIDSSGDIFFTSTDGNLYALKPDGKEIWKLHTGGASPSSPVFDRSGTIYVGANQYALALTPDGKKIWQYPLGDDWIESSPTVTESLIYFTDRDGYVAGFKPDGTLAWIQMLYAQVDSSPLVGRDGTLYLAYQGDLGAFLPTNAPHLAKSPWPMFRANYEHTGRANNAH